MDNYIIRSAVIVLEGDLAAVWNGTGFSPVERCDHGAPRDAHRAYGDIGFACPIGHCKCCGSFFPYIDMAFGDGRSWRGHRWSDENHCGKCGGAYEEFDETNERHEEPEPPSLQDRLKAYKEKKATNGSKDNG